MSRSGLVLVLLLACVHVATAQGEAWELTESLDIPEAAFTMSYPAGYTLTEFEDGYQLAPGWEPIRDASVQMTEPTSIARAYVMAEFESDVEPATDADWSTSPEGAVIYLLSSPMEDWQVDASMNALEVSMTVADILGMSTFGRTPVGVMGKLGVLCDGFILTEDRYGVNAIWSDDGQVFVLGVETAGSPAFGDLDDEVMALLATFQSAPVAPLDGLVELESPGYVVSVPSPWTLDDGDGGFALFENPDSGVGMTVINITLSADEIGSIGIAEPTIADLFEFIVNPYFQIDEPVLAEMLIVGEPALSFSGESQEIGFWVDVVIVILGENVQTFVHVATDAESLEAYEPTFHAILQSVAFISPDDAE